MLGKFYYDASKQRTAIIEEIDTRGGGQEFFYVINLYSEVHLCIFLVCVYIKPNLLVYHTWVTEYLSMTYPSIYSRWPLQSPITNSVL